MKKIIYLRVSKEEEGKQDLNTQLKSILEKFNLKERDCLVIKDRGSAYKIEKESKRIGFNTLIKTLFKEHKLTNIFKDNYETEPIELYVWAYDRLSRVLEKQLLFVNSALLFGVKIFSVKEDFLNKNMTDNIDKSPTEKIAFYLQIQMLSYGAELESYNTRKRILKAITTNESGETISYKGNKWGRNSMNKELKERILELSRKKNPVTGLLYSIREIHTIITDEWREKREKKIVSLKRKKWTEKRIVDKIKKDFKKKPVGITSIHKTIVEENEK